MSNLFRWIFGLSSALGGLFFSAFVDNIFSRIISHVIETTYESFTRNMEQPNRDMLIANAIDLEIEHADNEKCWLCFEPNTHTVIARGLGITHSHSEMCWQWIRHRESRFKEVVLLLGVRHLAIKARINMAELLPATNYAAHLIFKTTPDSEGLDTKQKALIYVDEFKWKKNVCVNPRVLMPLNRCNVFPVNRSDGWMELELGQFYCHIGTGVVMVSIEETDATRQKSGLIVAGIELRPIYVNHLIP